MHLRPYQTALLEDLRGAIRELPTGKKRVLVQLPTGGGKTAIFTVGIVKPTYEGGRRVWVVVPRTQLVEQCHRKLKELAVPHGVMRGDDYRTDYSQRVQVCSQQTLVNRMRKDKLQPPDVLVFDEAHHVADGNSFGAIASAFPDAIQVGVTATPCRLDGKGLGDVFARMVSGPSINDLIAMRYLVPPRVFAAAAPDLSDVRKVGSDYNQGQLGKAMGKTKVLGDLLAEYATKGEGRRAVVFAVNVEHSHSVVDMFNGAGIKAAHIDAKTPEQERQRLIAQLDRHEINILSSVGVFTEGFDLPSVGCVILARPTLSLSLYIQMVGRGLRPAKGMAEDGENCIILDHAGLTARHGFITDDREWTLDGGAKQKAEAKRYACKECGAELVGYPSICPACGAVLKAEEMEQQEIQLGDTTPLVEIKPGETSAADMIMRQDHYNELENRGFLMGWEAWRVGWTFKKTWDEYPTRRDKARSQHLIRLYQDPTTQKWEARWKHEVEQQQEGVA